MPSGDVSNVRTILTVIDSLSERVGRVTSWLCLVLVMVVMYEVIARHVFNAPTIWAYETGSMIGAAIFCLGWAYVHKHKGHIRIDLIYGHLSQRSQALIDVLCAVLLLFPTVTVLMWIAARRIVLSLSMDERLAMTFWYPPAAPLRAVIFVGLLLLLIQSLAEFIRDLLTLMRYED